MLMKTTDKNISILQNEFNDEFENSQRNKYFVLNLYGDEYAIEISSIAAIIEAVKTLFVPGETAGTNLFIEHKCRFIPAVSLRKKLNLPEVKDQTAIIINISQTQRALIVDPVIEIEDIDINGSEKVVSAAAGSGGDFIKASCRVNGKVKNILDIEKIFSL